ncbi:MAG: hypothetical protein HUU16_20330 [Candidatus Omnitrophica bacterium]|nr:hypothetical protein [Candidatus Omnitrophota bacterium]
MRSGTTRGLLVLGLIVSLAPASSGTFELLGVPVRKAGLMGVLVGPGPTEGSERIYFNFRQDGGKLFLVSVDPESGTSEQFQSPVGTGAWGFMVGPDGRIYLGTHEGPDPGDSGQILAFDPRQPDKQIQVVGRPSETETYLWMFDLGRDGKIYGCTYPNAKLISHDPSTGAMEDLGRMDNEQMYTREICVGSNGRVYLGIGYGRANVVEYNPQTKSHRSILPEEYRRHPAQTSASVYRGTDGEVYIRATSVEEKPEGGVPRPVVLHVTEAGVVPEESPAPPVSKAILRDGRTVQNPTLNGTYDLVSPDGKVEKKTFTYRGDGAGIFMVANGPSGRIYGGTYMPNELFWHDPSSGETENPGNPSEVNGEIYSMLDHQGFLYTCSYPGSFLSKWNPSLPWNYGRSPESNPRGFGPLGKGHLRPRAMIHGPENLIFIGSYPEYGMHGGSLGVWDPKEDRLLDNFHHLIQNQAIVSLVHDPETGLVFGGSSTEGGGGTTPVEPAAKFFAFDWGRKALALEDTPFPGTRAIRSLALIGRKIHGVAGADNLFVYDISKREYVHKGKLPFPGMLDCSLQAWKDGRLYGLTAKTVFALNPETFVAEALAEYSDGTIRCGFAIDDRGIYFGDRARLVRWNW